MSRYCKSRETMDADEPEVNNEPKPKLVQRNEHNFQIQQYKKEVVAIGQGMDNFIRKSVTTPTDIDKIERALGWRPTPLCNEIDINQIDPMCLPFVFTIDQSLIKSACAMMAIVKTRDNLNSMFDIVGGKSETKTALVDMKIKIQTGLDHYAKSVHKTGSNFLHLSKAFSTIYKVVQCEGDCTRLIKNLKDIETEFGLQNRQLEEGIGKIVGLIRESEKKILLLQNRNLESEIKKLQENVQEKKKLAETHKKQYEETIKTIQDSKIKLKQRLARNACDQELANKEIKLINKDIENNKKLEQKYIKLLETESKKLHDDSILKENEYDTHIRGLKKLMMDEIDLSYKEARKDLNERINSVMEQIADIKQDLVRLAQLERNEQNYHNVHNNQKDNVLLVQTTTVEDDEIKHEIEKDFSKLRELRLEELKILDLHLDELHKKRSQLLQEHKNQMMQLTTELTNEQETNKVKIFHNNIKYEEDNWIKHITQMKQKCTEKSGELKITLIKLNEKIAGLKEDKIEIDSKLKGFDESHKQEISHAQESYDAAKNEWKDQIRIYNQEMNNFEHKYGCGDIITIATSLSVLSRQCENIGIEFQQIGSSISFAREAFNGQEFQDLIDLLPTNNKAQPFLEIAECYSKVSLMAFSAFQEPLNALLTNNKQKEILLTKPKIEEPQDD